MKLIKKVLNFIAAASLLVPSYLALAEEERRKFCQVDQNSIFVQVPCLFRGAGPAGQTTFGGIVIVVLNVVLLVVGALAVLFLILGGLRYILSSGNEEQAEKAKKTMISAIIGLLVVILSFTMITIITRFLITGTP